MRSTNWPLRLQETIKAAHGAAFSWGENDCCLFVADCCIAVCGVDPAEKYRGNYKTRRSAFGLVKRTHGSLESAFDAYFERVEPAFAGRGDICLFESPDGPCVGVLFAGQIWAMTEDGVSATTTEPNIYWSVQHVESG